MGACRETYSLRRNPRRLLRWRTWRWNADLVFKDNVAWLICAVLGHRPYNTSMVFDPPEHACHRCGQWLRALDPDEWTCNRHGGMFYRVRDGCAQCREENARKHVSPLDVLTRVR